MRHGENLGYKDLTLNEKEERFSSNTIKRMIEYDLQRMAEQFSPNMERAISLSGPAVGDHQFILANYKNVIFPEIDKHAWSLMLKSLRGNNKVFKTYSVISYRNSNRKNQYSDEGSSLPNRTELRFANFFDIYHETEEFGLVDFDGIERPNQILLDNILSIVNTNKAKDIWVLRLAVCLRGNLYDPTAFIKHISNAIGKRATILDLYKRSYCETHMERNQKGAPMLTIQWVIK